MIERVKGMHHAAYIFYLERVHSFQIAQLLTWPRPPRYLQPHRGAIHPNPSKSTDRGNERIQKWLEGFQVGERTWEQESAGTGNADLCKERSAFSKSSQRFGL